MKRTVLLAVCTAGVAYALFLARPSPSLELDAGWLDDTEDAGIETLFDGGVDPLLDGGPPDPLPLPDDDVIPVPPGESPPPPVQE